MRSALLALLLWPALLWGQQVTLPAEVKGQPGAFVIVKAEADGAAVQWHPCDSGLSIIPAELLKDSKTCVAMAGRPGRYRLMAWTAKGDVPSPAAVCVVVIGDAPDPGPGPGPGPGPKPDPDPPVPTGEMRVLIVYESMDVSKMPAAQQGIIYGRQMREYLDAKTPEGPDGKTNEWRIYDKDVDLSGEAVTWRTAMTASKHTPGIVVLKGANVAYAGPLPATVEETLSLLAKYER